MKRILSLLAIATFASCSIFAQDDMYFTPKSKAVKEKEKAEAKAAREKKLAEERAAWEKEQARIRAAEEREQARQDSINLTVKKEWFRKNKHRISQTEDGHLVYHRGRDCSDDEYNRRGKFASTYTVVSDSTASDIIEFTPGDGQYPDSLIASLDTTDVTVKKKSTDRYDDEDDYYYSRRMNRFDDFYGSRRYWLLYNNPWHSYWAYDPFFWNDPWYWNSSWVYSPWYWNDPWYYGGYYGYYGGYYGGWGGYYTTTYIPHHHHHVHYTPVVLGGTVSTGRNGGYVSRTTHGTQSPRQNYRGFSSELKSFRKYDNGNPGYVTKDRNFIGYRGNRGNRSYATDSGNNNSSSSNSARDYSQRSYSTSSPRSSSSSYSNSSSSSSSRSYSRSNSSSSYSNSPSSSSSRSYSSSSSSSSSRSSGGSYGGGGGGSRSGGGMRHGGSR